MQIRSTRRSSGPLVQFAQRELTSALKRRTQGLLLAASRLRCVRPHPLSFIRRFRTPDHELGVEVAVRLRRSHRRIVGYEFSRGCADHENKSAVLGRIVNCP